LAADGETVRRAACARSPFSSRSAPTGRD